MRPNISVLTRSFVALLLLGLAGSPPPAQAETTACQAITVVPFTIPASGIYCLTGDLATNLASGEAITIAANNVVLDLNGHKLGNLAAGPTTAAVGIFALDRKDITIKNGTVQGFTVGILLQDFSATSQGHIIEDIRADRNTQEGIEVQGRGILVRNNQVVATGGSTKGPNQGAIGIVVAGPENLVFNNDVIHTFGTGTGTSRGIETFGSGDLLVTDLLVFNNRITQAQFGIRVNNAASTGKLRDNLTSGVGTPFDHPDGVIDAGGNN